MTSHLDALDKFNAVMTESLTLADTWLDLAGSDADSPQWPNAVHSMMRRLLAAAEQLEESIRRQS